MFNSVFQMLKRAKSLPNRKIFLKVFLDKEVQQFIIDLNAIDQLFSKGLDSEGELTGVYAFTHFDNPKKKKGEHYNFLDTGEFLHSFSVVVFVNESFKIKADTQKDEDDLIEKFGPLLGLTDESRSRLQAEILPRIIREVRAVILTG